ncbi:hypothetical protein [Acinetobacter pullicarnis]|uniref:hypothetical protein n=1 Tax=Acinetobacter pullicarnis TaxID=2576829 RepID=UPI001124B35C|nr:hypothetical protein [Acinetobacter pullicarnis]
MKALIWSDEVNQLHWSMLKSVVFILALLPANDFLLQLWQSTEGSSQIFIGFTVISVFSALSILGFIFALLASTLKLTEEHLFSVVERRVLQVYRYIPMLLLMVILSYLATQI